VINKHSKYKKELSSEIHTVIYRLKRRELDYLDNQYFFENDIQLKDVYRDKIKKIALELRSYAKRSFRKAKQYYNTLDNDGKERYEYFLIHKKLDELHANYKYYLYYKSDLIKALKNMNDIKEFLVTNAIYNDFPFSEELLKYFADERILLDNFCKVAILKDKIQKDKEEVSKDWIKHSFDNIIQSLEKIEQQFKYEYKSKSGYKLEILSSSFAGNFSEFLVHLLLQKFKEFGRNLKEIPTKFNSLLKDVLMVSSKEEIILKADFPKGDSDIDVYIKGKCAIFLKNSRISRNAQKDIWNELELCRRNTILKVYYLINFNKNLENIEKIRNFHNNLKHEFNDIKLNLFDIKDLVMELIEFFENHKIKIFGFPTIDLFKILNI